MRHEQVTMHGHRISYREAGDPGQPVLLLVHGIFSSVEGMLADLPRSAMQRWHERYEGRVLLDGRPVTGLSRDIGFIFQEPRLFPWLTVTENVGFDLGRTWRRQPAVARRIAELLAEVGLSALADALPKQLSGGQAQRVAIARGLFTQPRVLLLDEPFSAVDAFTRMALQDLLLRVARHHGTTVLLVTHDIDEATTLADRVWVLDSHPETGGSLAADIAIPLAQPRPRDLAALATHRSAVLQALQAVHAI